MEVLAVDGDAAVAKARKEGLVADRVELVQVTHLEFDVAGVSHPNIDGTSRQATVKRCKRGESLILEREIGNPHGATATTIHRENGEQVGYVPAERSVAVAEWHRIGCNHSARVIDVVSLGKDTDLITVRLCVVLALPDANPRTVVKYVTDVLPTIDARWSVEQFMPRRPIREHAYVPPREKSRDSSGRFATKGVARPTGSRQSTPSKKGSGCLLLVIPILVAIGWVGWKLFS